MVNDMDNDLKFVWQAEFDDGAILDQFEEDVENPFSMVEDNISALVKFSVISVDDSLEVYSADLITGVIGGNGILEQVAGSDFELIYKRRNEVRSEVGTNKIIEARKTHMIGLKSSTDEKTIEVFQPIGVLNKRVHVRDKTNNRVDKTTDLVRGRPAHAESKRDFDKLPSEARVRK